MRSETSEAWTLVVSRRELIAPVSVVSLAVLGHRPGRSPSRLPLLFLRFPRSHRVAGRPTAPNGRLDGWSALLGPERGRRADGRRSGVAVHCPERRAQSPWQPEGAAPGLGANALDGLPRRPTACSGGSVISPRPVACIAAGQQTAVRNEIANKSALAQLRLLEPDRSSAARRRATVRRMLRPLKST